MSQAIQDLVAREVTTIEQAIENEVAAGMCACATKLRTAQIEGYRGNGIASNVATELDSLLQDFRTRAVRRYVDEAALELLTWIDARTAGGDDSTTVTGRVVVDDEEQGEPDRPSEIEVCPEDAGEYSDSFDEESDDDPGDDGGLWCPEYFPVRPREMVRALKRMGFYIDRQRGDHKILRHASSPSDHVTVPMSHPAAGIAPGTFRNILRRAARILGLAEIEITTRPFELRVLRGGLDGRATLKTA